MKHITFLIDDDLSERAEKLIPRGLKSPVLRTLLIKSLDAAEKHGTLVFGAILDGAFHLEVEDKR
jgi:hypothetical protein